jgi:hypothetical protein
MMNDDAGGPPRRSTQLIWIDAELLASHHFERQRAVSDDALGLLPGTGRRQASRWVERGELVGLLVRKPP